MRTSALQYLYLQKPISSVVIICAIALLPFISGDFYTKGEPREASVAVSMLSSGNWILPKVYADEFAYKPPMAHWLMAACSLPQGEVTEFSSRLPSAIALIVLLGFTLAFFGKRIRFQEAFIATLLLMTCFEIHRAGMAARVDMILTTFTVLGLMQLYRWENKLNLKGLPVIIPLLFSAAALTKGPVGIILPLFIFFVYLCILRKYRFGKILKCCLYVGVSSLFIPLIWYVEAYLDGGKDFLDVTLAENFGRFFHLSEEAINYNLGHKESVFYNFITLISGFIPWTLLFVFSLFGAKWRMPGKSFKQILRDAWIWFVSIEKMKRFSIVATVCIIFFFSIPSSKRSVYLMPAYPFISILLAQYFIYITENRAKVTRIFAIFITSVVSIAFLAGLAIMTGLIEPAALVARFTSDESIRNSVLGIASADSISAWIIMFVLLVAICTVIYQTTKRINIKILYSTILLSFALNLFIDGIVMPGVREASSARLFAEQIAAKYDLSNEKVYVMNNLREYGNLYAMNFYLGNSFHNFESEKSTSGYFLTTEKDLEKVLQNYSGRYKFERLETSLYQGDIRSKAVLLRFALLSPESAGYKD
ncbi:MAG: glycosyltransferase family 39 protein [Tannerella sp.]|jgi:4-amino-4-deoxy-L-arabinose transferase-like glycosyltransferase|nr:glycosyltransferase family 39 protein [Tannerella sp.]